MAAEKKSTASPGSGSKRTSTRKSSGADQGEGSSSTQKSSGRSRSRASGAGAPRAEAGRRMTGSRAAEAAARQLGELTSKEIEGVTGLQRTDEGWQVELEVLELRRIPATTDVLASYEVRLDTSGGLEEYRRGRRYVRGQVEGGT